MAATPSTMIPLETQAPDFTLPDVVSGKRINLKESKGEKATVIMFICNHCPYVKLINPGIVNLSKDYTARGVQVIAISSNDISQYPDDAPDKMLMVAKQLGYDFPYLYDETQEVARAYDAACTPDLFVFDGNLKLKYRGQFDAARPGNSERVTGKDVRAALDAILEGKDPDPVQRPSIGCNIKWKK
jgi:peroxiredoxin